jgi:hypothetical protein
MRLMQDVQCTAAHLAITDNKLAGSTSGAAAVCGVATSPFRKATTTVSARTQATLVDATTAPLPDCNDFAMNQV